MKQLVLALSITTLLIAQRVPLSAQTSNKDTSGPICPMHLEHGKQDPHAAAVEANGDRAMGFAHDKTTHHFLMANDGGAIEVTANDPSDNLDIESIRTHLAQVASMFGNGDYSTPMLVHGAIPPGVTTMKLVKDRISFKFEPINAGGRVRIELSDPIALAAIHDFLRFQITDHQTGDPLVVEPTR
jgi:hypothetical protein